MTTHETPFGNVDIRPQGVTITAHAGQLFSWAHRPGAIWPCSRLDDLDEISATFDYHGLVDMTTRPMLDPDGHVIDPPADEFNAWSSDVLRDILPESHPAHFVTVGQFD